MLNRCWNSAPLLQYPGSFFVVPSNFLKVVTLLTRQVGFPVTVCLVQARRQLALRIREGRSALYENDGQLALKKANESEAMAGELKDLRASRAVTRLKASALKQVSLCFTFCTFKQKKHKLFQSLSQLMLGDSTTGRRSESCTGTAGDSSVYLPPAGGPLARF